MTTYITDNTRMLEYSPDDFELTASPWPQESEFTVSSFDKLLFTSWDCIEKEGVFWYDLSEVENKPLKGDYGMVAQLNMKRFAQRRKPEESSDVIMKFNPGKFNFNKIKPEEVLFNLKKRHLKDFTDRIIINVSPIEYGHFLLTPCFTDCLPQVLDNHSVEVAAEITLLTAHRGFIIGFNSLCALASVNHLHLQAMYLKHCLPIMNCKTKALSGDLHTLDGYMVNGYAIQLQNERQLMKFSENVTEITTFLSTHSIPHNVAMCKRKLFGDVDDGVTYVTIFIFPKKKAPEVSDDPFNCAFVELSGLLPIKDVFEYESMTEDKALDVMAKYTYNLKEFEDLSSNLLRNLSRFRT